ncbi:MAG TPA: hypothetical protein VFE60_08840 [Roseiarcus sp.]|nr:hypothetical protein [Roseiarcus sp.]
MCITDILPLRPDQAHVGARRRRRHVRPDPQRLDPVRRAGYGSTFDTEYRTVSNLTAERYFFELTTAPNVIWTDLTKLNFSEGAPVLTLNPNNIDLSGDVTLQFQPAKAPF